MPPKGKLKSSSSLSTQSAPTLSLSSPKTRASKLRALASSVKNDATEPAAPGAGPSSEITSEPAAKGAGTLVKPAASSAGPVLPVATSAGSTLPAASSAGDSSSVAPIVDQSSHALDLPGSYTEDGTTRTTSSSRFASQLPVRSSLKLGKSTPSNSGSSGIPVPKRFVTAPGLVTGASLPDKPRRRLSVEIEEIPDVDAPRGSPTPSFNSLVRDASDSSAEPSVYYEGNGVYDDESISQGLAKNRLLEEYDEIFTSVAREVKIHDEPLVASIARYSPRYDPLVDDDPLYAYGAEDGILPGRSLAESMMFRDILVRWTTPHRLLLWVDLNESIKELQEIRPQKHDLLGYADPSGSPMYSLGTMRLMTVGHQVLAIQQILNGLWSFLGLDKRNAFILDPDYKFLKLLEYHSSRTELVMTYGVLMTRLYIATIHIRKYLVAIKRTFRSDVESDLASSVDSTRPSVRSDFGSRPVMAELARMVARPDYGAVIDTFDSEARKRLIDSAKSSGVPIPDVFYVQSLKNDGKQYRSPFWPTGALATKAESQQESATRTGDAVSQGPKVAFDLPESLSSIGRPHTLSTLPGMGPLPDIRTLGAQTNASVIVPITSNALAPTGGPSFIRPTAFQEGDTLKTAAAGLSGWTSHVWKSIPPSATVVPSVPNPGAVPNASGLPGSHGGFPGPSGGGGGPGGGGGGPPFGGSSGVPNPNPPPTLPNDVPPVPPVPTNGGGGGGDGGGGGGGGGGPVPVINDNAAAANLYWNEWQLNKKLHSNIIPSWDGQGDTAIDYIAAMADLARLSAQMSVGLAQLAYSKWTGRALQWWNALPQVDKAYISRSWDYLILAIRAHFLDAQWVQERTFEFEEMRFRQAGEEKEDPIDFLQRRIRYHSFLYPDTPDGPMAISRILRTQPVEWGATLNSNDCIGIYDLQQKASQFSTTLISVYNVGRRMRSWGAEKDGASQAKSFRRGSYKRAAKNVEFEDGNDSSDASSEVDEEDTDAPVSNVFATTGSGPSRGGSYGRGRGGQRGGRNQSTPRKPWPEGKTIDGYSFARDDSVASKAPPPGNCFICTSPRHYARDCPHFGKWDVLRNANLIHVDMEESDWTEDERLYLAMLAETKDTISAYMSDSESSKSSGTTDSQTSKSSINSAAERKEIFTVDAISTGAFALHAKRPHYADNRNSRRRARFESKGKTKDTKVSNEMPRKVFRRHERRTRKTGEGVLLNRASYSPLTSRVIPAVKGRSYPDGYGSLGTRALHMKAFVSDLGQEPIRARLDSGADITLMSEDYWKTIPDLGKPKEGIRMKLYHLTGNARVLGYVKTQLFAVATDGNVVSFDLEAYVVKDMRVPLLLGEDFQVSYELGLRRYATGHCEVLVGGSGRVIAASSAQAVDLGFSIRSAQVGQSFVRAKSARRARANARRNAGDDGPPSVLADEDVLIAAGSVHNVRVNAPFEGRSDWLVEKVVIGMEEGSLLSAPTTWVNSKHPYLPVANPGVRPWYIRTGDIIGYLLNPEEDLDRPRTEEEWAKYAASADSIRAMVEGTLRAQDLADAPPKNNFVPTGDDKLEGEENWGPKTTEVPDPDPVTGIDVTELVNLGEDIPDDIRPRLEEVLRKNVLAFGVDGRLGHVDARVPVNLKPGTQPISVPMYTASPAKREVIDKQMKLWFEAGVIEPSTSPWGFPIVVVYRNGKPRCVIDYRKLNAETIPDEFPIPRQTEIIQSLSGAQVLSSFDALAGFTQLEMADEEKEKTAFRSHLGLWQFRRMPFGLRNGPSIFQRVMQGVLSPYLWLFTLVYIDDIVVYSKSWEEHLVHLDKVLGAIAAAGITLSPAKCFVGYSSILLLGQKVSRLGLSTHQEKVSAIQDIERPKTVNDLQKFLGMVVYFASYIPHYAFIAAPLFGLLKKGVRFIWKAEHDIAFQQAKDALMSAPVLGHPIQGLPYRLYTDASDFALGASLQQVQSIAVADLKGTTVYSKLLAAWEAGLPIPSLVTTLVRDVIDRERPRIEEWGATFDETIVHVERVICYWSRTLKPAERNYSATEREALGAKEALVRFQPFIEGETVILVTDHAALQWARVYENTNRRLAAWGAVFAAYPGMTIIHRPGKIHSNVDPLSRLPRIPHHDSPIRDDIPTIVPDEDKQHVAQGAEDRAHFSPAPKAAFSVWRFEDVVDKQTYALQTRRQKRMLEETARKERLAQELRTDGGVNAALGRDLETTPVKDNEDPLPFAQEDHWTYPVGVRRKALEKEELDDDWNRGNHLLLSIKPEIMKEFADAYVEDGYFKKKYVIETPNSKKELTPSHFRTGNNGLLYFIDADWNTRLCVPRKKVPFILRWMHESPYESAHAGPRRFLARLQELFFWPTMRKDVDVYTTTCDVCQKIKNDHRRKQGGLRPAHIPARPFATVTLDLITGLPPSGEGKFTAVLVVVDKFTKYARLIATHDTLKQDGFAKLFVDNIANVFGLPNRIIADRDKRWSTAFWKSVVAYYGSVMALSSAHHPQTDGQTENLNATIEVMLRAYVASERESWADWLSEMQRAYNSSVHSSTTYAPDFLLMGYKPQVAAGLLVPQKDGVERPFLPSQKGETFIEDIETHRRSARDALVLAQERQARAHNKHRRAVDELQEGDWALVNPHTLELVDVKGTGRKLIQRTIGPFEVMEKVNPMVYRLRLPDNYPMHPVFNLDHLRKYHQSSSEFGERTVLPPTRDFIDFDDQFEVEAILGHRLANRKNGNRRMYLVRWKGYDAEDDSWVSEHALRLAPILRREYLRMKNLPPS